MAVTETIQELLNGIDSSQYGRDMRQYIHKGIQKCYEEGSAGETDLTARNRLDDVEASMIEMQESIDEGIASTQGNIATTETTNIASKAYAVGDYLMYNGKLYKVTTAIASGGTISVGANVVEAKVEESMKKADVVGTCKSTFFEPENKSGSQYGTAVAIGEGTWLILFRARVSSELVNASAKAYLRINGATEPLFDKTLTQADSRDCDFVMITSTDSGAYFTPNFIRNSGDFLIAEIYMVAVRIQ